MEIKLTHSFLNYVYNLNELLEDCNKLSTFCSRLEKQSILFPDRFDPNLYKGDGFELFVEALLKLHSVDRRIGISNYEPISKTIQDIGVDGSGTGINNFPATVQVKYRSNNVSLLTANTDHLSNFVAGSLLHYKVNPEHNDNMLIITTAKGLHHFTDIEMYASKVRCLGSEELKKLVDNNDMFWNAFRKLCDE